MEREKQRGNDNETTAAPAQGEGDEIQPSLTTGHPDSFDLLFLAATSLNGISVSVASNNSDFHLSTLEIIMGSKRNTKKAPRQVLPVVIEKGMSYFRLLMEHG